MKTIFKDYLFNQHILVSDQEESQNWFETVFSLAHFFNIHVDGTTAKLAHPDMIKLCQNKLGINVPEPFYRGFPQSVRRLTPTELLFDQLLNYAVTYGMGNFKEATHSIFEENFKRTAFKEDTPVKEFTIITEVEAMEKLAMIIDNLLAGTRPLSIVQYNLFLEYTKDYHFVPTKFASKNTLVKYLIDTKDLTYVKFMQMSDVIKLVDEMNWQLYENKNIKKLHFTMNDRRFVTAVIDKLFELDKCDVEVCFEKKKIWCGLLHHIGYRGKNREAKDFCWMIRNKGNISAYSLFEKNMKIGLPVTATAILKRNKGVTAVLRNLEYILSRCTTLDEIEKVFDTISDSKNAIVLMQLLFKYSYYKDSKDPRTFTFTKYNQIRCHKETEDERSRRRTHLNNLTISVLKTKIQEMLEAALKGRLGRVYIEEDMYRYAIPLQNNTSQGGFGVLPTGSKLQIPEGKKIRAFTYWEKVNDIDLSCFGIDTDGKRTEFSWRTMSLRQSDAVTYSGDVTSGYNGGSEYFDIDLDALKKRYPNMKYMIFANNVYSGINFDQCYCTAGYMVRDIIDSGEIFEPKAVASSYKIDCQSTYAYLFGIDFDTRELVWLNIAQEGNSRVAGETEFEFLLKYFDMTKCINMQSLFTMMATEIVDYEDADIIVADVIVTDKNITSTYGNVEVIHPYDFDKILKYING